MPLNDFFPLVRGAERQYAISNSEGHGILSVEIVSVTSADGRIIALCRQTTLLDNKLPTVVDYDIVKDAAEIRTGGVTELKFPLSKGTEWIISPRRYTIEALDAEVSTPAGTFRNCLRVAYLIAEGDGGSGERFYAPGVGLVKIVENDEGEPFTHELISHSS